MNVTQHSSYERLYPRDRHDPRKKFFFANEKPFEPSSPQIARMKFSYSDVAAGLCACRFLPWRVKRATAFAQARGIEWPDFKMAFKRLEPAGAEACRYATVRYAPAGAFDQKSTVSDSLVLMPGAVVMPVPETRPPAIMM